MSRYDLAGSHIPLLLKAVQATTGEILELGMGWNSTPLLHWICKDLGRKVVSMESDRKWLEYFNDYRSDDHMILPVDNWQDIQMIDRMKWGVVLVDHRPAIRRHTEAIRLKTNTQIVLLHDSEPEIDRFYAYRRTYPHFKYRYDYTKFKPFTTALSNYIDVAKELS